MKPHYTLIKCSFVVVISYNYVIIKKSCRFSGVKIFHLNTEYNIMSSEITRGIPFKNIALVYVTQQCNTCYAYLQLLPRYSVIKDGEVT